MEEISKDMIKTLREQTGAGLGDCKKALQEKNGNLEEAIKFLREKGLANAAKKADRAASEGLISIKLSDNHKTGVMVELNCETDFVTKTDAFQSAVNEIADLALTKKIGNVADLLKEKISAANIEVQEWIKEKIALIGENIVLSKVHCLIEKNNSYIAVYQHGTGRIGVMAQFGLEKPELIAKEEFLALTKGICMHIAAANPTYLDSKNVDQNELNKEREIYRNQMLEQGKPANIVDKIVEGKLSKFYEEVCLLEQEYIIEEDKRKVKAVLEGVAKKINGKIEILSFKRFELGTKEK